MRLSCDPVRKGGQLRVDLAEITGGQEGPVKLSRKRFHMLAVAGFGGASGSSLNQTAPTSGVPVHRPSSGVDASADHSLGSAPP